MEDFFLKHFSLPRQNSPILFYTEILLICNPLTAVTRMTACLPNVIDSAAGDSGQWSIGLIKGHH